MRLKLDGVRAQSRVALLKKLATKCRICGVQATSLNHENFLYRVTIDEDDESGISDTGTIISPDGIVVTYATRDEVYWGYAEFFGQPITMRTLIGCAEYDDEGNCTKKAPIPNGVYNSVGLAISSPVQVSSPLSEIFNAHIIYTQDSTTWLLGYPTTLFNGATDTIGFRPKYTGASEVTGTVGATSFSGDYRVFLARNTDVPNVASTSINIFNGRTRVSTTLYTTSFPLQAYIPNPSTSFTSITIKSLPTLIRQVGGVFSFQLFSITTYVDPSLPSGGVQPNKISVMSTLFSVDTSTGTFSGYTRTLLDCSYSYVLNPPGLFDLYLSSPSMHIFNRVVWSDGVYPIIWGSVVPRHIVPTSPIGFMRLDHAPIINPGTGDHDFEYDFVNGDSSGFSFPPTLLDPFVRADHITIELPDNLFVRALITRQFQDETTSHHTITHLYFGDFSTSWVERPLPATTYALRIITYSPSIEMVAVAANSAGTGLSVWQYTNGTSGYEWRELSQITPQSTPADPEQYLWAVGLYGNPVTSRDRAAGSIPAFPSIFSPI